jgi:hypothetical protein
MPGAVAAFEDSRLDELSHELLEKERIALRATDQELLDLGRELHREQTVEHLCSGLGRKRLEPDRRRVPPAGTPGRPTGEQLGTRGRQQQHGPAHVSYDPLEEIEEVVLGPVDVLDEEHERPLGRDLLDELDDRLVQTLARVQWVQAAGDVEPEGEAENLAAGEPPADLVR